MIADAAGFAAYEDLELITDEGYIPPASCLSDLPTFTSIS